MRSRWRHEQQTVAAVLATMQHHSAPRGQKAARTRGGGGARRSTRRSSVQGPAQAAGAQYFSVGDDEEEAPAARRPAPLIEVRPQRGYERHCGSAAAVLGWREARVGVRIRRCGHGFCPRSSWFGARVFIAVPDVRWSTDTAMWARVLLLLFVVWCLCVYCRDVLYASVSGYGDVVRDCQDSAESVH